MLVSFDLTENKISSLWTKAISYHMANIYCAVLSVQFQSKSINVPCKKHICIRLMFCWLFCVCLGGLLKLSRVLKQISVTDALSRDDIHAVFICTENTDHEEHIR